MSPAAPPEFQSGDLIADRYRIVRKISTGGMGTVYLAQHALIERLVAIKILSAEFASAAEGTERFLLEARAAARIVHENIIAVHDFGETEDSLFIVMEYLEGRDLGDVLRSGELLPPERIVHIMSQVCRALAAAHAAGIIHRDLKPENIFITQREGQPDLVKVLDFGVAQVREQEEKPSRERLTRAGTVVGTPEYMAPEQVLGDPLDLRADVYALGCILYEMLVGVAPFSGRSSTVVTMAKRLYEPPVPPSQRVQHPVPPGLEALCLRALERDRDLRFQTMPDMLAALLETDEAALLAQSQGGTALAKRTGSAQVALPAAEAAPDSEAAAPVDAPAMAPAGDAPLEPAPAAEAPPAPTRVWRYLLFASALSAGVALFVTLHFFRGPTAPPPVPAPPIPKVAEATAAPQPAPPEKAPVPEAPEAAPAPAGPAAPIEEARPLPRLRIAKGTKDAQVRLNGRQYLGKIPLDITIPMVENVRHERAFVLVRKPACEELRFDIVLDRGAVLDHEATLICQRQPRGATVRRGKGAKVVPEKGDQAPPKKDPAPGGDDTLRNPFKF